MRIVPNLNEVYFCPNCDSPELYVVKTGMTEYKYCPRCHEVIRESDIVIDNSSPNAISIPYDESRTIKADNEKTASREQEEKDKFLFNLREEIDRLRYNILDTYSMMFVNKLTDIFIQIADYIENH